MSPKDPKLRQSSPFGYPVTGDRDQQRPKHARLESRPDPFDDTGRLEGVELDEARAARDPDDRVGHLEKRVDSNTSKIDKLDQSVDDLKLTCATNFTAINTKLDTLPGVITLLRDELRAERENKHTVIKQTFDIDQINAKARAETSVIAVTGRWKSIGTIVGGVFGVGTLTAILTLLASGKC